MGTPPLRFAIATLVLVLSFLTAAFADDRGFDVRLGPAAREQYGPYLATNGDTWMAAWLDNRSGVFDVYASPLDGRGQPRFPEGIPVATTSSCEVGLRPLVAWTGSSYALVWSVSGTIYAARLATNGEIVSTPSEIFEIPTQSGACAVAWDGSRFLVAWPDSGDIFVKSDVHAVLLDTNFNRVSTVILLSPEALLQPSVLVAGGDARFLVTMSDRVAATSYEVRTAVVANDGSVSAGGTVEGTSGGRLAWSGSEWAMTWEGSDGHIRFTTISSEGVPGTVTVLPAEWVSGPDVAWDGSAFRVAFKGYRGPLFTIRVSSAGESFDPAPVQLTETSFATVSDMSPNARGMLVGWTDYRTGINIFDSLLPHVGAAVIPPEQLLAQSLEEQGSSSIATSGSLGLAVWTELIDSSTPVLRATRVSASGVQLDQPPIEFQRGGMIGGTVVAASADGFLVAWIALADDGWTRVMTAQIDRNGSVVASSAFGIGEAVQGPLRIATNGHDFLVVSVVNDGIVGWRLGRSSQDAVRFMIAASPALNVHLWAPDVTFNGSAFVVTWIASTSCGRNCYFQDLYVADLKDGATDHVTKIGTAAGPATLASDGENTFVVWPYQGTVSVALLDQDLRTIAQSEAGDHDMPASLVDAAWVGSRWFLTWTAQDSDEYSECMHVSRSHLESASFAPDLSHLTGAQLTAPDDGSHSPSVANAGSSVLLLYERFVPTAPALHRGGINRIFLRAIGVPRQRATVR
jgi:hypothetical protein